MSGMYGQAMRTAIRWATSALAIIAVGLAVALVIAAFGHGPRSTFHAAGGHVHGAGTAGVAHHQEAVADASASRSSAPVMIVGSASMPIVLVLPGRCPEDKDATGSCTMTVCGLSGAALASHDCGLFDGQAPGAALTPDVAHSVAGHHPGMPTPPPRSL